MVDASPLSVHRLHHPLEAHTTRSRSFAATLRRKAKHIQWFTVF